MALLVFNRIALRSLPILFGVMAVAWVSYMTVPFLEGHVVSMIKEIGSVGDTLTTNVTNRIAGSVEHQTVVSLRLFFTLALWAVAGVGALIRFRDGRRDLTMVLLAAAPVPLIALQAYGGELVLRLYLFSLPFVTILVAGVVYGRRPTAPGRLLSAATVAVTLVIAFGFLVVRYGNERTDVMTDSNWPPSRSSTGSPRPARSSWRHPITCPGSSRSSNSTTTSRSPTKSSSETWARSRTSWPTRSIRTRSSS